MLKLEPNILDWAKGWVLMTDLHLRRRLGNFFRTKQEPVLVFSKVTAKIMAGLFRNSRLGLPINNKEENI